MVLSVASPIDDAFATLAIIDPAPMSRVEPSSPTTAEAIAVETAAAAEYPPHPLAGLLGSTLILLHHEYEEFIAAGGDPAQFTPSDSRIREVANGQITVDLVTTEPLYREYEPDPIRDPDNVIRTDNTAFVEQLKEEIEGLGMEVTAMDRERVSVRLPIDALDDLAQVQGVDRVSVHWHSNPLPGDLFRSVPLSEVLDADILRAYENYQQFGYLNPYSGWISLDIVTDEPAATEQIVDGYRVEVGNHELFSRFAAAATLTNVQIREFGLTADVLIDELGYLAEVKGVKLITRAGAAGQPAPDPTPTPPDGSKGTDPPAEIILPVETIVPSARVRWPDLMPDVGSPVAPGILLPVPVEDGGGHMPVIDDYTSPAMDSIAPPLHDAALGEALTVGDNWSAISDPSILANALKFATLDAHAQQNDNVTTESTNPLEFYLYLYGAWD